ncbi:unnamed protein product, partial [Mesorhabditis spiculigera]
MINFNEPAMNMMVSGPVWKVLIMDKVGQDIISPLLTVKQLRELGVTLHMLLDGKREPLPDVPAVYFVNPSNENIAMICRDMQLRYYLNFASALPRNELEQLAQGAVRENCVDQVKKVVDQYLKFISLENDLFVLKRSTAGRPLTFYTINDLATSEDVMNGMIQSIADGLFSVCATLGLVPIIRAAKEGAAEQVALRLCQKLKDTLCETNNVFTFTVNRAGMLTGTRPILVIADRSADLATMLHHTWTDQALIHDVLGLDQNRVTMQEKGKKVDHDLHGEHDRIWSSHKGSPFPLVAEAIQSDLEHYRTQKEEVEKMRNAMGIEGSEMEAAMSSLIIDTTSKLGSTVTSLPQLLEQKRLIDLHTNIATSLLNAIKERQLDSLFELEQKMLQKASLDSSIRSELEKYGDHGDVLRVVLLYYLSTDRLSKSDVEELRTLLREKNIDDVALRFVERIRSVSNLGRGITSEAHSGAGTSTVGMFGKLLGQSSKFVMEGVKNLVPRKHNLPLTKLVDSVATPASSSVVGISAMSQAQPEGDALLYLDPKLPAGRPDSAKLRPSTMPHDVLLFVVGGGNYVEYENVAQWGRDKGIQRVIYGSTELISPLQFTEQLSSLGKQYQ